MNPSLMQSALRVFLKELLDALRDRRTLLVVCASSVALGPLVLVLISQLVGSMEKRAEARVIVVQGIEHAPGLRNFLERQTYTIQAAPPDFEQQLKDSKLGDPVLVVPADFEALQARGEAPVVELMSSSGNQRANAGSGRVLRLLQAYNREQAQLRLAVRGIPPEIVKTRVSFDTDASFPKLKFTFGGFLDADTQETVDGLFGTEAVKEITGETPRTPVAVPKIAAPAPVAPRPAVRAAAPVEEPAPAPAPAQAAAPKRGFGASKPAAPAAAAPRFRRLSAWVATPPSWPVTPSPSAAAMCTWWTLCCCPAATAMASCKRCAGHSQTAR
jgi:hypothetical protein